MCKYLKIDGRNHLCSHPLRNEGVFIEKNKEAIKSVFPKRNVVPNGECPFFNDPQRTCRYYE